MTTTAIAFALSLPFIIALVVLTARVARHGGYNSGHTLRHIESDWASGDLPSAYYSARTNSALR